MGGIALGKITCVTCWVRYLISYGDNTAIVFANQHFPTIVEKPLVNNFGCYFEKLSF